MPTKYLELDSNYRNRNLDGNENPASFICQISQTGINNQSTALDPITYAYPLNTFKISETVGTFTYTVPSASTGLGTSSPSKFILKDTTGSADAKNAHANDGYFVGAVLQYQVSTSPIAYSPYRILEWTSLGNDQYLVSLEQNIPLTGTSATVINFDIFQGSSTTTAAWLTSPQYVFLPDTLSIPNYYTKYLLYNQTKGNYSKISSFDKDTHLAKLESDVGVTGLGWNPNGSDVLILRQELPRNLAGVYNITGTNNYTSGLSNAVALTSGANPVIVDESFINNFIRMFSSLTGYVDVQINRILSIVIQITPKVGTPYYTASNGGNINYLRTLGSISYTNYVIIDSPVFNPVLPATSFYCEVMPFSVDNCSPFTYNGSLVSQNQAVSYDIGLNSLTLPNLLLANGGRIAYYPYIYVEIENVSTTTGPNRNVIYSNNPNTYKAIFKVPITDLNHPLTTPFVKLNGNGMIQTMTFKPNTDMAVSVKLPNGTLFKTLKPDNPPGQPPNPLLQLSFLFSMTRI